MKNFKAGMNVSQGSYKSFQPENINRQWIVDNMELLNLLSQADRHLGRLDMFSEYIPNIDLFISMHILKEATKSSKIEGTKTNIEDALLEKDDVDIEKKDDWIEVQNYVAALNSAMDQLEKLPFSSRLIKQTHKELLKGARGKHKLPGEFRRSQNWIGGVSLSDAVFIPPIHTSVGSYMGDLEKFAHNQEFILPELLKIALMHYQFETIHPFLDGNGRVGRLMITLYLVEKGILKKPVLYLSDFFERNRNFYYDNLMLVRNKNDLTQWFKFFLVGIIETAKSSINTFDLIMKLQKAIDERLQKIGGRLQNAYAVMNYLYQRPIIDVQKVRKITNQSPPSAYKLIEQLEGAGILHEVTGAKRGKQYLFKEYFNLFIN